MYITIVCFLITAFIFVSFGKIATEWFDKNNARHYTTFDSYFVGICFAGTVVNFWSVFLPSNIILFGVLFFASILYCYTKKVKVLKYIKEKWLWIKTNKLLFALYGVVFVLVLMVSITLPCQYDSYLYHINAIQWSEMYSAVPGLANLHTRFGFNSSVFTLNAAFSFSAVYNQMLFVVNSLSFLVFFLWTVKEAYYRKNILSLFLIVFVHFFNGQYILDISSPGTDILVNILVSFLLISILLDNEIVAKKPFLFIALSLFCLTLKISVLPIVLLAVYGAYIQSKTNIRLSAKVLIVCTVVFVLPWILRNIILTGYVLYPFETLDLFSFDWKVPRENVIELKKWIYSWGRIPNKNCDEVLAMGFSEWFPIWWNAMSVKNQVFLKLVCISPVIAAICMLFFEKRKRVVTLLVFVILYLCALLWFFTAPDIRFSFGVILLLALSPLVLAENINFVSRQKYFGFIAFFVFSYAMYAAFRNAVFLFTEEYKTFSSTEYIYLPKDVYYLKEKRKIKFNKVKLKTNGSNKEIIFYEPKQIPLLCHDKFPCSWSIDPRLKLRGETLEEGFYQE